MLSMEKKSQEHVVSTHEHMNTYYIIFEYTIYIYRIVKSTLIWLQSLSIFIAPTFRLVKRTKHATDKWVYWTLH